MSLEDAAGQRIGLRLVFVLVSLEDAAGQRIGLRFVFVLVSLEDAAGQGIGLRFVFVLMSLVEGSRRESVDNPVLVQRLSGILSRNAKMKLASLSDRDQSTIGESLAVSGRSKGRTGPRARVAAELEPGFCSSGIFDVDFEHQQTCRRNVGREARCTAGVMQGRIDVAERCSSAKSFIRRLSGTPAEEDQNGAQEVRSIAVSRHYSPFLRPTGPELIGSEIVPRSAIASASENAYPSADRVK